MKFWILGILILAFTSGVLAITYVGIDEYDMGGNDASGSEESIQNLTDRWYEQITKVGAANAYAEFADEEKTRTQQQQHVDAHAFGQAVYEALGIDGIAICDARFSYGCFHQMIGLALAESGTEIIPEVLDTCKQSLHEKWNACKHSVGHGIVSYVGYGLPDLESALAMCDSIPNVRPVPECYRGAFMEYNFQAMLGEEARTRTLGDDSMYPCSELAGTSSRACYYMQPQLWRNIELARATVEQIFPVLGDRCALLADENRSTCFEGIGTSIAWDTDYAVQQRAALCDAAAETLRDRVSCRSQLGFWLRRILATEPHETYVPLDACEGLPAEGQKSCEAFVSIEYPGEQNGVE